MKRKGKTTITVEVKCPGHAGAWQMECDILSVTGKKFDR